MSLRKLFALRLTPQSEAILGTTQVRNEAGGYTWPVDNWTRLDDVVKLLPETGGGGTNCALPVNWAHKRNVPVDAFVILTDSQTWHVNHHPAQAVQKYRQKVGIRAKSVVVTMAANRHAIGDPNDGGVLNVIGLDTATTQLMADFIAN